MHGSGTVSAKGEPRVWPCSCAAQWQVHSGKPQSDNTCPLSRGCRKRCSCPGDRKRTTELKCSSSEISRLYHRVLYLNRFSHLSLFCMFSRMNSSAWIISLQIQDHQHLHSPSSSSHPPVPPPRCGGRQRQRKSTVIEAFSGAGHKNKHEFHFKIQLQHC